MNIKIFYFFYNLSHKSFIFDQIVVFITDKADILVLLSALVYLFYFFASHPKWKRRSLSLWFTECFVVVASILSSYGVTFILKVIFHAPRPFVTLTNVHPLVSETPFTSFPSAHAALFFGLATALYLYNKRAGFVFFIIAIIIALSRLVVGVHYPVDIFAGALIGIGVSWSIHRYISKFCQLYLFPQKPVK